MKTAEELIGRVIYGGAADDDRRALERLIKSDEAVRRDYVDAVRMHVFLSRHQEVIRSAVRPVPVAAPRRRWTAAAGLLLFLGLAAGAAVVVTTIATGSVSRDAVVLASESVVANGQVGIVVPDSSSGSCRVDAASTVPGAASASSSSSSSESVKPETSAMNTFLKMLGSASSSVVLASAAPGASVYWLGGSNTWQTASAWSSGAVPASGDDVVITNGTAEYVPGGDLVVETSGSLTVGAGGRFVQTTGNAWPNILGALRIDGGEFDTGTAGAFRMGKAGSLVMSRGSFMCRTGFTAEGAITVSGGGFKCVGDLANAGTLIVSNGTVEVLGALSNSGDITCAGGKVALSNGGLVLSDSFAITGGIVTFPGELQFSGLQILRGGQVTCGLVSSQAASSSLTLAGGSVIATNPAYAGFYQNASYLDFETASTSTVTFAGVDATNVYATCFSGAAPKIRYNGEAVAGADFTNLFSVAEAVNGAGTVTIGLKGGAAAELAFLDGACWATDVGATAATLSATVEKAGSPAATVYACWGTSDAGAAFAGWDHVAALGTATNGAACSDEIAVASGTFYYYRMALSNETGVVFAKPSPKAFMAGDSVNAFTGGASALASDPDNWSKGIVPGASDTVVFTPVIAAQEMTWDADAPKTVAGWTQPGPFPSGKTDWCVTFATTVAALLAITGSCRLEAGRWTHVGPSATPSNAVAVTVGGDLYVGTNAQINAGNGVANDARGKPRGYYLAGPGFRDGTGASYGGEGATNDITYGSILNPMAYGSSGRGDNEFFAGGGLVVLKVQGRTTVCGGILANGFGWPGTGRGASSGGTVNLVTGTLAGDGAFQAVGGTDTLRGSGSGGRIRVRLMGAGAGFNGFSGTMSAAGGPGLALTNTVAAAAGTICLQTVKDKAAEGTVIVDNPLLEGAADPVRATHLPAMRGEDASLTETSWIVRNHGILRLTRSLKIKALEFSDSGRLDLNGQMLRAETAVIGGEKLPPGHYTAASSATVLSGAGSLEVGRSGFCVIIL